MGFLKTSILYSASVPGTAIRAINMSFNTGLTNSQKKGVWFFSDVDTTGRIENLEYEL
jgi:hypothetical protein